MIPSSNLFETQPESCRLPLQKKEIIYTDYIKGRLDLIKRYERVLFYDPTELYKRIGHLIDPHKRHSGLSMDQVFPKLEKYCACGCGQEAEASSPDIKNPWQRKWSKGFGCQEFAGDVLSIINNYFKKPVTYMKLYVGNICEECNECDGEELDHIIGVKHGGGGCWLSNYKWLCAKCHRNKTNTDFGFKGMSKTQINIEL